MEPRLSPEEMAAAKAYMRIEGEDEDPLVMSMVLAARTYLTEAGVALPEAGSGRRALYDLVCHGLALAYYERREATGAAVDENPAIRRALNQLKLTEPMSNLDTGSAEGDGDHGGTDP